MKEARKGSRATPTPRRSPLSMPAGLPDVRMVLVKKFDERGFVFFTNAESAKGQELAGNLKAALVLHWKSLNRQMRVRGTVERVSEQESDAYFASRPRGAQIGAWASQQSRPLESRSTLEAAVARFEKEYAGERAAPALLGRLSHRAACDRILGRSAVPAARPARLHAPGAGQAVGAGAALSVKRRLRASVFHLKKR